MGNPRFLAPKIFAFALVPVLLSGCTQISGLSRSWFATAFGQSGCPRIHTTLGVPSIGTAAAGKGLSPYWDAATMTQIGALTPPFYDVYGLTEFVGRHQLRNFNLLNRFGDWLLRPGTQTRANNFMSFRAWTVLDVPAEMRALLPGVEEVELASSLSAGGGVAVYRRDVGAATWIEVMRAEGGLLVGGGDATTLICSGSARVPLTSPQELLLVTSFAEGDNIFHPYTNGVGPRAGVELGWLVPGHSAQCGQEYNPSAPPLGSADGGMIPAQALQLPASVRQENGLAPCP